MLGCATIRAPKTKHADGRRQSPGQQKHPMSVKQFSRVIIPSVLIALFVSATFFVPQAQAEQQKEFTAEQVVETLILFSGTRAGLAQVRKTGLENGRMSRMTQEGRPEEVRYQLRFIHGDKIEKDKVRLDQKTPQAEYSLIKNEDRLFGIINGSAFTPRAETAAEFLSQQTHSIEALLRYKENDSKLASAGKDKQQGIDLYVIDLTDKANHKTRYFISAKTFRVLWLEYEETPPDQNTAVKYMKRFYDYRYAQSTLVPYRTVLTVDGKQTLETRILTVTYGVKMEDDLFKSPEAASGME
jgi:hypothetical protein